MIFEGTGPLKWSPKTSSFAFGCVFVHRDRDILYILASPIAIAMFGCMSTSLNYLSFVLTICGHQLIRNDSESGATPHQFTVVLKACSWLGFQNPVRVTSYEKKSLLQSRIMLSGRSGALKRFWLWLVGAIPAPCRGRDLLTKRMLPKRCERLAIIVGSGKGTRCHPKRYPFSDAVKT